MSVAVGGVSFLSCWGRSLMMACLVFRAIVKSVFNGTKSSLNVIFESFAFRVGDPAHLQQQQETQSSSLFPHWEGHHHLLRHQTQTRTRPLFSWFPRHGRHICHPLDAMCLTLGSAGQQMLTQILHPIVTMRSQKMKFSRKMVTRKLM